MKTASDIEELVWGQLKVSSQIASLKLTGGVYRQGYRPANSQLEDAVVSFTAGVPGELHTAIVTINVFVPDISYGAGTMDKNGTRCAAIETALAAWYTTLMVPGYQFDLQDTIHTTPEEDIHQHFVVCRLHLTIYDS